MSTEYKLKDRAIVMALKIGLMFLAASEWKDYSENEKRQQRLNVATYGMQLQSNYSLRVTVFLALCYENGTYKKTLSISSSAVTELRCRTLGRCNWTMLYLMSGQRYPSPHRNM